MHEKDMTAQSKFKEYMFRICMFKHFNDHSGKKRVGKASEFDRE